MLRRTAFIFTVLCLLIVVSIQAQTGLGTLSGYVLAADGKTGVPNARVYLQPGNGHAAHTLLTDKQGHYSFTKVHPGLYDLRAHANDSWSEQRRNVVVKANREMDVDLKIVPAKVAAAKPTSQK
ncbi:MAG TPA: carboxypeptidase-like regulatory domain-containing protein [Candidatus Limnocylindrales bacterium]|nr:carboxypeptidase-like regulatory domain-containing protein [Candidatus Limnocylindrales bacterium]